MKVISYKNFDMRTIVTPRLMITQHSSRVTTKFTAMKMTIGM